MNEREENMLNEVETYEPPEWLTGSLRLFRDSTYGTETESVSEDFRRRCQDAADVAFRITKLRWERQRIGFVPMSLAAYVEGLVKVAGVQFASVLAWLGIEDLSRPTPETARAMARLAKELGIDLREALAHIRIGFAEGVDAAPMPLLLARYRSSSPRSKVEECEAVLGMVESGYDIAWVTELRRTEFEVRAAYKEHGSAVE